MTPAAPPAGVTTESLPRRSPVAVEALGTVFVFVMFFAAAALL